MADAAAALNAVPAQYQAQLDQIALRRQMAQALLKQVASARHQGQMVGGRYIAPSPLNYVGDLGTGLAAALAQSMAARDQSKVQAQYQADRAADFQKYTALKSGQPASVNTLAVPGDFYGAVKFGSQSQFPELQAAAAKDLDANTKMIEGAAPYVTAASLQKARLSGNIGDLQTVTPHVESVTIPTGPDGKGTMTVPVSIDATGKQTIDARGNTVVNNLGGNFIDKAAEDQLKTMSEGRAQNLAGGQLLNSLNLLADIRNSGVMQTGALADKVVALQKLAGTFGFPPPSSTSNYEEYQTQLFTELANNLHQFGSKLSNKDLAVATGALPGAEQETNSAMANIANAQRGILQKIQVNNANVDQFKQFTAPSLAATGQYDPRQADFYKTDALGNGPSTVVWPKGYQPPGAPPSGAPWTSGQPAPTAPPAASPSPPPGAVADDDVVKTLLGGLADQTLSPDDRSAMEQKLVQTIAQRHPGQPFNLQVPASPTSDPSPQPQIPTPPDGGPAVPVPVPTPQVSVAPQNPLGQQPPPAMPQPAPQVAPPPAAAPDPRNFRVPLPSEVMPPPPAPAPAPPAPSVPVVRKWLGGDATDGLQGVLPPELIAMLQGQPVPGGA